MNTGDIRLSHVSFSYASRPDVVVLSDVSLRVSRGTQVALVGIICCIFIKMAYL